MQAQDEAKEKALQAFCDDIRLRGGVKCRMAIVDDDRKEFFRGKDLQKYCTEEPAKLEGLVNTGVRTAAAWPLRYGASAWIPAPSLTQIPHARSPETARCSTGWYPCGLERIGALQRGRWKRK